jgi:hypothetical protein
MATLQQQLNQAKLARKGNPMKWVTTGVVVVALGVGGYFGYPYLRDWMAKRKEAAQQASAPPPDTNAVPAPPPPPREPPMVPAVWTLDLDQAKTPSGKVNGMISGTNFVPDVARLDKVGTGCWLSFLQGAPAAPDRGFRVYLRLNAGESVTGRTWTVTQDLKDRNLPQVVKIWKTDPRYAATQKSYSSGYAMKLELGDVTDGLISGKIFLALPDTEQSVVAGVFKANATLADAAAATVAPNPGPAPGAPSPAGRAAFDQRYGRKR